MAMFFAGLQSEEKLIATVLRQKAVSGKPRLDVRWTIARLQSVRSPNPLTSRAFLLLLRWKRHEHVHSTFQLRVLPLQLYSGERLGEFSGRKVGNESPEGADHRKLRFFHWRLRRVVTF